MSKIKSKAEFDRLIQAPCDDPIRELCIRELIEIMNERGEAYYQLLLSQLYGAYLDGAFDGAGIEYETTR